MRKIGITITSWNRYQQTIDSFANVSDDDRVEEITITDDASTDHSFDKLHYYFRNSPKVNLFRNEVNLDCYGCKHTTVENSSSQFLILLDSDNIIGKDYLDALYQIHEWNVQTIYQPCFAKPYFDFRKWNGLTLTKENVAEFADTDLMTALNANNFFINRNEYLRVWDGSVNPMSSDSIYFCYCWLAAGNKIYITPNLQYEHFIDPAGKGHYQTHSHLTVGFHEHLMKRLRELK